MTIYLYLKTHNKTGMKYLGKTVRDPFKYNGSGKRWKNHLKVHGTDITTEILFITEDEMLFRLVATAYSKLFDIVRREDFANLVEEQGEGGDTFSGRKHKDSTILLMKSVKRNPISEETRKKISKTKTGVSNKITKPRTAEHKKALSESLKGKKAWNEGVSGYKINVIETVCPHCNKIGRGGGFYAWHFDNCLTLGDSKRLTRKISKNDNIFFTKRNGYIVLACKVHFRGISKRKSIKYDESLSDIIYAELREWRDKTLTEMGISIIYEDNETED